MQLSRGLARVVAAAALRAAAACGAGDEAGEPGLVERAGAEEALVEVAAPFGEQVQLGGAFDAFDDDRQLELAGEADHRLDDDPVAAAADDVGDQRRGRS